MSKPYDATAKALLEADPAGWAGWLGVRRPAGIVSVIDSDLSTVSRAADKVIRVADPDPWILHVEFLSANQVTIGRQMLNYNALLQARHECPVASVLVVLTKDGNSPTYGTWRVEPPVGPAWEFRYTVVRLYELPPDDLLAGPTALVPLALAAGIPDGELPAVLSRAAGRLRTDPSRSDVLVKACAVLLRLRYGAMALESLLDEIPDVFQEPPFDRLVAKWREEGRAEGRAEEVRKMLLRQGRKKYGPPTPETESALNAITDIDRLEAMCERLLDVASWDELLA